LRYLTSWYARPFSQRLHAQPSIQWPGVLRNLSTLLCETGLLEIIDDGHTYRGSRYNANMSTFGMSYEEHFLFTLRERGFSEELLSTRHWERLVERPLAAVPGMAPVTAPRSQLQVQNPEPKLDWRWRKTLFLAEEAVRQTLIPIVGRTEPDEDRGPRMSAQEKQDLFAQDVDGLVGLLKVYVLYPALLPASDYGRCSCRLAARRTPIDIARIRSTC
jgi:hypothetical protein